MEAGTYIDSNEAYLADSFVRNELADMLFFYYRDSVGSFPEELGLHGFDYPKDHAEIAEMLSYEDDVRMIVEQMNLSLIHICATATFPICSDISENRSICRYGLSAGGS